MRHFAGHVQKEIVDLPNIKTFFVNMVLRKGFFWKSLEKTMNIYSCENMIELPKLGIITTFSYGPTNVEIYDDNCPLRLSQRSLCRKLFDQSFSAVQSFLKQYQHNYDGYPAQWFEFEDPDLSDDRKGAR